MWLYTIVCDLKQNARMHNTNLTQIFLRVNKIEYVILFC